MHVNGRIELAGGQSLLAARHVASVVDWWLTCAGGKAIADPAPRLDLVSLIISWRGAQLCADASI